MQMNYLLYCIFRSCPDTLPPGLRGVADVPVEVVSQNGLSSAVSMLETPEVPFDIGALQRFEKVSAALFARCTIIPMRYGSILPGKQQIFQHLGEHGPCYTSLLKELEGCVEMGIRILISKCEMRPSSSSTIRNVDFKRTGKSYLIARKNHYDQAVRFKEESERIVERIRTAFAELFVQFKTECTASAISMSPVFNLQRQLSNPPAAQFTPPSILSLYFLVPKKSVEAFRQTFRHVNNAESLKLLLSGPWPPFSFVVPARSLVAPNACMERKNGWQNPKDI